MSRLQKKWGMRVLNHPFLYRYRKPKKMNKDLIKFLVVSRTMKSTLHGDNMELATVARVILWKRKTYVQWKKSLAAYDMEWV